MLQTDMGTGLYRREASTDHLDIATITIKVKFVRKIRNDELRSQLKLLRTIKVVPTVISLPLLKKRSKSGDKLIIDERRK